MPINWILGHKTKHFLCVRTYVELVRTYVIVNWLILWKNVLVFGQIQDMFSTSRNKSSSLVLKPYKSVKKTSEEVLFIKAQWIARQINLPRFNKNSQQLSTEVVSIENYEIQISRSVFRAYPSYLCKVTFLTTLYIYKDFFKGRLG